jgi:hypothetical protein
MHLEQIQSGLVLSVDEGVDDISDVGFLLEEDSERFVLKDFRFEG